MIYEISWVEKYMHKSFSFKHEIMHNEICTNHASSKKFLFTTLYFLQKIISQFMIFKASNVYRLFIDNYNVHENIKCIIKL